VRRRREAGRCLPSRQVRARQMAEPARRSRRKTAAAAKVQKRVSLSRSGRWWHFGRLNGKFPLQEGRRRGLYFAHPCLGGAGRSEVFGLYANALAVLLFRIDACLVGLFVGRRLALFLFAALFFLSLERSLDDGFVVLGCGIVRLDGQHFVVSL